MGKRRVRRLAALSNAGRRVKLDLFAEPSGDLGASSVHDEVGGDIDPTQRAGVPNSPSSSGQEPQNPLLLLGQYSDDELDDESNKILNHTVAENSPADLNDEEPRSEIEDVDANTVVEGDDQKVELEAGKRVSTPDDVLQSQENFDSKGVDTAASADVCNSAEQASVLEAFHAQHTGDISLGWRMVMHEESSQYYYWNIETGETSWEPPDVLVQETQSTFDQNPLVTENTESASKGTDDLSSNLGDMDNHLAAFTTDNTAGANLIPQSEGTHGDVPQKNGLAEGCRRESLQDKNWITDAHQTELKPNKTTVNTFLDDGNLVVNLHDAIADDENKRAIALSTSLMKQCESLLERLKSLKGYENQIQDDRILKYVLEVEIRLSDIKSLSTYGSSLLPFWTHSENQLKQLEDAINYEIYELAVSAQLGDIVEANGDSCFKDEEQSQQSVRLESEAHGYESGRKFESSSASMNVENGSPDEAAQQSSVYANHSSSAKSPVRHLADGVAVNEEGNGTAHLMPEFHDGEDVDMDVDMEIEDEVPTTTLGDALTTKEPNPSTGFQPLASENALTVPPPPEEEWIPPPPPDNDLVPPPPPDNDQLPPPPPEEPSESSYSSLPPYADHTEQYSSLYPDSELQYYGHPVNLASSNLYGHADGSQVATPNASIYYEANVANTYTETAAVIVGPAESLAYYNLQDGSVPPMPIVGGVGVETSHLLTESGPVIYETLSSDQVITADDSVEARPTVKHDVAVVSGGTDLASAVVRSALTSTQASISNAKEDISVTSTDSVTAIEAAPAPSTIAKTQSKVVRSKKKTVAVAHSLRSNKKVNSLVDKWKAVKEELNEIEEDEPENPYEILEKKRQREIEEWHARQVASGEARDNANFQPLGGDWRERVKRRRAQAVKEAAQTPAEVSPTDESQQPNLAEVSRGLPSGWQAYWDEGSKQVYYGNAITSETTWTRPAK